MLLVIDRIEDGIAVCEELSKAHAEAYGRRYEFTLSELPQGVREGDVLDYENNKLTPNPEAARERRNEIRKLMTDVFD